MICAAKRPGVESREPLRGEAVELWLDPIPADLRPKAMASFEAGDYEGFLFLASNVYSVALVFRNASGLQDRGIYEAALLYALSATRTNNRHYTMSGLRFLLEIADPARLRAAGDPLPPGTQFEVFRGVAGRGRNRRVRGISWTLDIGKAEWFATRYELPNQAIYTGLVSESHILAYTNARDESEIIVLPENVRHIRPCRVGCSN